MNDEIKLLYIDLFCGAGGTSTGVELARLDGRKCAKVVACVNHDAHAIASHQANHPDTMHFTEDIRTLELSPMVAHLAECRKRYPAARTVLWASLECTNFSKAKGGQPRDADSRTLAEHLFRYIDAIQPDYIQIENVEEFMSWGDLDADGHPISKDNGRCYVRWVKHVCNYGYTFDWRILNAANYGAYTSRRRFFGQFARVGMEQEWPIATYAKNGDEGGLFAAQYHRWRPVREVLDLDDEGESIFGREKPLCEATLNRIYAGLVKFVAGGKDRAEAWLLKYNSTNSRGKHVPPSIDEPCPTVAVQNRLGLVRCNFLSKQFGGDPSGKNIGIDHPAGTITCKDHHAFVTAYYGNGYNASVDGPAPTVTTADRFGLVSTRFIDNQYGNGRPSAIDEPSGTLATKPKQNGVAVKQFLMNPYSFKSNGGSIDKPCFTLIARMDKMPPYLLSTEEGVGIAIMDDDSPMMRKVKEFMAAYGIIDIRMRMLKVVELKRIMGFPDDYVLIGTQAEQKKFIGNAVEVNQSRVLCEALAKSVG
ncbi:MAG: DNA cytosine methyltransferase [Bacteroidales bacterium]|nr:DNA cytosine methyltransferase [Bacteroidales bacterium]